MEKPHSIAVHVYRLIIDFTYSSSRYHTTKHERETWQKYHKESLGIALPDKEIRVTYLGKEIDNNRYVKDAILFKMRVVITREVTYRERKPVALVSREWRQAFKGKIGLPITKKETTVTYLGTRGFQYPKLETGSLPRK